MIREINAFKRALIATPESITEDFVFPASLEMKITDRVAINEPKNAKIGVKSKCIEVGKSKEIATSNPPPELTPIMLGDANALSVMLWSKTPETERPMPHKIPDKIRGNLTLYKIVVFSLPLKARALKNSTNDIFAEPSDNEAINTHKSSRKRHK